MTGDAALNALSARAFADPDDDRAIRAIVGTPLPCTTNGLVEAAWVLVPLLQARGGTAVALAAEARLTSILAVLDLRTLTGPAARSRNDLEQHRRRARREQRRTDLTASVVIAFVVAVVASPVMWLVSLLGVWYVVGVLAAVPVLFLGVYLAVRAMSRAESEAERVTVRGLRVDPWLRDALPPVPAAATQLALALPDGPLRAEHHAELGTLLVTDGAGLVAIVPDRRFLQDVAGRGPSTADDVTDLLGDYLRPGAPGVLHLSGQVPPAVEWGRGVQHPWARLVDRFDATGPITVTWYVFGAGLVANLGLERETPTVTMFADLAALVSGSGAAAVTSPDDAADLLAGALLEQLVHGDRVMFTRGGSAADREMLVAALRGGDLEAAASRSQWTGEC